MNNSIKLHQFILDHKEEMTNKWLEVRSYGDTFYPSDIPSEYIKLLREQNIQFITLLANIIIDDHHDYTWANEVSTERVKSKTPLHTSLGNFKKFRTIFWDYMMLFAEKHPVSTEELATWGKVINESIDTIMECFSVNYDNENNKMITSKNKMIMELSSPVIALNQKTGILPLIGEIDTDRASSIKENTLLQCNVLQLDLLVIDLSGVPFMDTMVANEIYQLSDMLSLIGVKTAITGITPEIAQVTIRLGLNFKNITIYNTLQQALPILLENSEI